MTTKRYDSIANVCMWVAIVSALVFDWMGSLRWVAGGIGIAAGFLSAVNYFYNQWHPDNGEHLSSEEGRLPDSAVQQYEEVRRLVREHIAQSGQMERINWVRGAGFDQLSFIDPFRVSETTSMRYFHGNEPGLYVNEFVKIVTKLSSLSATEHRHIYEFEIRADGRCTIRVKQDTSALSEEHPSAARTRRRSRPIHGALNLRTVG